MKTQLAYCSACDRDVQLIVTDAPLVDGQATLLESEVVCLDIGSQCTGGLCPLCAEPVSAIVGRLVHDGMLPRTVPTTRAQCDACGRVTDLVRLEDGHVVCTECGTTSRWSALPER
jgi:hypothetical protein